MRLATIQIDGRTCAARVEGSGYVLLGFADVGELLADPGWRDLAQADGETVDAEGIRLLPVVLNPRKILCLSRNYAAHAAEGGNEPPPHPDMFVKFASSMIGAYDDIPKPRVSEKLDWEAELAVIIGTGGRNIPHERALDHVAGYSVSNDITVRDWQHRTQQWTAGKAWDGLTPLGPHLVTADELPAGGAGLEIGCSVDGRVWQTSTTDHMVFDVATVIADVSTFTRLEPGDVILTGTPEGVGAAQRPQVFLAPGQTVTVWIEGVGETRNRIVV